MAQYTNEITWENFSPKELATQYTNEITCQNFSAKELAELAIEAAKRGDKLIIFDPENLAKWLNEFVAARNAITAIRMAIANFDL